MTSIVCVIVPLIYDIKIWTAYTRYRSDAYDPPSIWTAVEYGKPDARATGYELECLLKLEASYKVIRASLKSAIDQLEGWRPSWNRDYTDLDGSFSEEETVLGYMEKDLMQEEKKLARIQAERKSWQDSLPSADAYGFGDNKAVLYRRDRANLLADEEEVHLASIEKLKSDIQKQKAEVITRHQKVLPVLSVVNFAHSSYTLLSSVEETLSLEHRSIIARLHRPIDDIEDETWSRIFNFAVQLQEEENREALYMGLPLDTLKSPRRTTVSIAGVCRKWKNITRSDNELILWQNILVEATHIDATAFIQPLSPRHDPSLTGPISIDIITQKPDNLLGSFPPLLRWVRTFETANLGVIYSNTPFERIVPLLETVHARGALRALSLICRDVPSPPRTLLSSSIFTTIQYLELVDLNLHYGSFNFAMNTLVSLHIRHTRLPSFQERPSPTFIFRLLTNTPALEELEVDLGFEDSPTFIPVSFPKHGNALSHLRYLKTRLSYFQNRLSFLQQFPLPAMNSITLIDIPSWASDLEWDNFKNFLTTGVGGRIKHCEVLGIIPPKSGVAPSFILPAPFLTSEMANLQTLSLHKQAVDHFIEYLHENLNQGHNPIPKVQNICLWDAPITDDNLLGFVRLYCDTQSAPSSEGSSGGSTLGGVRHIPLQFLDLYRCSGVSTSALDSVAYMLRDCGRGWHEEASPADSLHD
jgi:hypothetical protein